MDARALDAAQRAVLDLPPTASAIVLGVAGSGKTHTILELVADRLAQGFATDELVVIAGTRASATSLRDRLAHRVEGVTLGPLARTMASLAHAVLAAEALAAGRPRPQLITGAEQDGILATLLAGHEASGTGPAWPDHLGPDVRAQPGFRTELRAVFARASELGIGHAGLAALDPSRAAWVAAAAVMAEYEAVLQLERRDPLAVLDASRLLHEAAASLAAGAAPRLRLVVVDDAQELTIGAVAMLEALAARGVQIIAFGDPDTATGRFRGADPALLGDVPRRLGGDVRRLELRTDHRHGDALRAAALEVSNGIGAALGATHRPAIAAGPVGTLEAIAAASEPDEAAEIARTLRERHVLDGVPWDEMAVVVRTQRMAQQLTRWLATLEVPTGAQGAASLRRSRTVGDLVGMLAVATGRAELTPELAETLLTSPLVGLDAVGIRRLRRALRHVAIHAGETHPAPAGELVAMALDAPDTLALLPGREARAARRLALALAAARDAATGDDPATADEVLWGIWQCMQVADDWRAAALGAGPDAVDANRRLDAVVALFEESSRHTERNPDLDAGGFVDAWRASALDDDSLAAKARGEIVQVGTPSAFVSREFDTVVVAGVQEAVWPNLRLRGSLLGASEIAGAAQSIADVLHDEQRMFLHAISRARSRVLVTAVASEDAMPSVFFAALAPEEAPRAASSTTEPAQRPMTLRALVGELRRRLATGPDAAAASALARLAREGVPGADPASWAGLATVSTDAPLTDIAAGEVRDVSPSSIERFQACPLDWAVSMLSGASSGQAASIGTIVHAAVEHADAPTTEAMLEVVGARWAELGFQAPWQSMREQRVVHEMVERLASYFAEIATAGWIIDESDHERRFVVEVEPARLRGSIDWIERSGDRVRIVDLKTGGTPPTRAKVAEHPQLRAYQLALARGAIGGLPDGAVAAGARLVTPKATTIAHEQAPLEYAELEAFESLVRETARGMAAATFEAQPSVHCSSGFSFGVCRIHTIAQVTE